MFSLCGILRKKKQDGVPDIGKLLYGKRKNVTHGFSATRPAATGMLEKVPNEQLAKATAHALALNELSSDDILSVLRQNRALKRLDRSEIVYNSVKKNRPKIINSYHLSLLMAHANDQRNVRKALHFWSEAVKLEKVNPKLHGALLQTYRNGGLWSKALEHCESMFEDKIPLDAHGTHSVLNVCRRNAPWMVGLQFFSRAIKEGVQPNEVVYLELLRILEQTHQLRNRWKYSLAILQALEGKVQVTAGHYNSVLSTLGGSQWERGVNLFHTMREKSIQPSKETLNTVSLLNTNNIPHSIRCIAEAHALQLPVSDTMYRLLLVNLFRQSLDHEAIPFMERELSRDTKQTGNPIRTTLPLMVALLDSLLTHPRPHNALLIYESFESKLGDVVKPATRNLGDLGALSQRWLVQGRVAVVDHTVVLSTRFESLQHHYDSIFIPFSSIRLLVRRARENGDSQQGRFMRMMLFRLGSLLEKEEWRMTRVLPLSHQLIAHTYIAEDEPYSTKALEEMRDEAKKIASVSFGQQLLDGLSSDVVGETGGSAASVAANVEDAGLLIRSGADDRHVVLSSNTKKAKKRDTTTNAEKTMRRKSFLHDAGTISSVERVTAVAVMLKSLNPDANVHVLSANHTQLANVAAWNKQCSNEAQILQSVKYPEELLEKAPPASFSSPMKTVEVEEEDAEFLAPDSGSDESLDEVSFRAPFMPS